MIPREDFAIETAELALDLIRDFPITNLNSDSPILKLLRKPDFQRETNHWVPDQIATFVATKSMVFVREAITSAIKCPICKGLLDPKKSVSYDHKVRVTDGGTGDAENAQMVHPYCNTGIKG